MINKITTRENRLVFYYPENPPIQKRDPMIEAQQENEEINHRLVEFGNSLTASLRSKKGATAYLNHLRKEVKGWLNDERTEKGEDFNSLLSKVDHATEKAIDEISKTKDPIDRSSIIIDFISTLRLDLFQYPNFDRELSYKIKAWGAIRSTNHWHGYNENERRFSMIDEQMDEMLRNEKKYLRIAKNPQKTREYLYSIYHEVRPLLLGNKEQELELNRLIKFALTATELKIENEEISSGKTRARLIYQILNTIAFRFFKDKWGTRQELEGRAHSWIQITYKLSEKKVDIRLRNIYREKAAQTKKFATENKLSAAKLRNFDIDINGDPEILIPQIVEIQTVGPVLLQMFDPSVEKLPITGVLDEKTYDLMQRLARYSRGKRKERE